MEHIKTLFLLFLSVGFFASGAQAAVYWIGRSIDFGVYAEDFPPAERSMIHAYGHSYVAVIPDNPRELAAELFPAKPQRYFDELEKDFGSGKKGFLLGGFPKDGSAALANMNGDLQLEINSSADMRPTKDYFAGENRDVWRFVGGLVEYEGMSDTQAAAALYRAARYYQQTSREEKVDYNAVHSVTEEFSPGEETANNCNALAFSLLAYSFASKVPDIGALRVMPGNRNLLPAKYFVLPGLYAPEWNPYNPRVFKKDFSYQKRYERQMRAEFARRAYNNALSGFSL